MCIRDSVGRDEAAAVRLGDHDREAVGEHVVHLADDPDAFGRHGEFGGAMLGLSLIHI